MILTRYQLRVLNKYGSRISDKFGVWQGRNEVYGIRDQRPKKGWDQGSQPRIRDQSPRDRDQRVFHGLKDQASRFCGIRDQNFHHFWDQGLKICVKIRDQRRKNIPRYDPGLGFKFFSQE